MDPLLEAPIRARCEQLGVDPAVVLAALEVGQFGGGMIVCEQLVTREDIEVTRSWADRLCSWPWRPWQKVETVVLEKPLVGAIELWSGCCIAHPAYLATLDDKPWAQLYKEAEYADERHETGGDPETEG